MKAHKIKFVKSARECGALQLKGRFLTPSGQVSPYFFDATRFSTGRRQRHLAAAYCHTIVSALAGRAPHVVFGPAYRGIPIAVACSLELGRLYGLEVGYLFDRKEWTVPAHITDESEAARARLVGHPLEPGMRIVLLDDVLMTAETKYRAVDLLRRAIPDIEIAALVIALDRHERGPDGKTASETFSEETGIPVHSILTAEELLDALREDLQADAQAVDRLAAYLSDPQS